MTDLTSGPQRGKALGICPRCNGSTRFPYTGHSPEYIWGYDPATRTIPCVNCGGQYQGIPPGHIPGRVPLAEDGKPCLHAYEEFGSSYQRMHGQHYYRCTRCGDTHYIDSGD
jgi:hypothetical protein